MRMRPSALLVLVLALVLGGAAAFMSREYLLSRTMPASPAPEVKTLVVARQPLPFGTALNEENTVEIPWPTATTLEDGFATKLQLFKEGRRVVLVPLQRNEPILASKITGPNQRATLSTMIE